MNLGVPKKAHLASIILLRVRYMIMQWVKVWKGGRGDRSYDASLNIMNGQLAKLRERTD